MPSLAAEIERTFPRDRFIIPEPTSVRLDVVDGNIVTSAGFATKLVSPSLGVLSNNARRPERHFRFQGSFGHETSWSLVGGKTILVGFDTDRNDAVIE